MLRWSGAGVLVLASYIAAGQQSFRSETRCTQRTSDLQPGALDRHPDVMTLFLQKSQLRQKIKSGILLSNSSVLFVLWFQVSSSTAVSDSNGGSNKKDHVINTTSVQIGCKPCMQLLKSTPSCTAPQKNSLLCLPRKSASTTGNNPFTTQQSRAHQKLNILLYMLHTVAYSL